MATNPLFQGSLPTPGKGPVPGFDPFTQETPKHISKTESAADLVRSKLSKLYANEPNAKQEMAEATTIKPRSKHQEFMYWLSTSGKSLADIQVEWHAYYQHLSDEEKHAVWQEFYDVHAEQKAAESREAKESLHSVHSNKAAVSHALPAPQPHVSIHEPVAAKTDTHAVKTLEQDIRHTARARGKLKAKHHFKAMAFGLGFGSLTLLITLFGFFNEVIIAPFIQPGRSANATPIILGANDVAPSKTPEVIIPKINVEIPLDFSVKTTNEDQIENALEGGVVHYPTTVLPGQKGNAAFFGHSSNNIFNKGKYKFAFVLLHELVPGDTFYLTYDQKIYAYQVYDKQVVDPSNVGVLNNVPGQTATATLITCDPPGTSLHRLVVWGKQVNPDPNNNATSTAAVPVQSSAAVKDDKKALPGNGPTLWGRFINWLTHS